MIRRIFVMLVAAGCGDGRSSAADAPGAPADAADAATSDASIPDAATCQPRVEPPPGCYGTTGVQICLAATPAEALTLSEMTIDTGSSAMCATVTSASGTYCVLAATDITVDGSVRAIGPHPLVLLATGSISITAEGSIDVGSHRPAAAGEEVGAGADPAACGAVPAPGEDGGDGGSLAGAGGQGSTKLVGAIRASKASSRARAALVAGLRGGCPGQSSKQTNVPDPGTTSRGGGGHGGGAVFLIATTSIAVDGAILATGEGGAGGGNNIDMPRRISGGGGGGGSGGVIGLDAPTVAATGLLLASGGGGGGGSGYPLFANTPGTDGDDATDVTPALGGTADRSSQPTGGAGSAPLVAGPGADAKQYVFAYGSGGGGGAGLIVAPATADLGTSISPPATGPCE